jgi:hypothetical protein
VRLPFLGDAKDLLLAGEVVEPIGGLDGFTEREVARQDDIFSLERDEEGALYGPGTDSRDRGELRHEFLVWQRAQDVRVQPAVRKPSWSVRHRGEDLLLGER